MNVEPVPPDAPARTDLAESQDYRNPVDFIAMSDAYSKQGKFAEAAACCERALAANSNLPMAHNNLGWARQCQGDWIAALGSYQSAVELNPSFMLAQVNLAFLLSDMGRDDEAARIWRILAAKNSSRRAVLIQCINGLLRTGDLVGASRAANSYAQLCRGSRWFKCRSKNTFVPEAPFPAPILTPAKLSHDIEQLNYLNHKGLLPKDLTDVMDTYRTLLQRLTSSSATGGNTQPLADDLKLVSDVYGRIIYKSQAPRVKRALSRAWQRKQAEEDYFAGSPKLVVLDEFLSAEALTSLRKFCLESTIWFANSYSYGRLGAFFREGFNCPLLMQIATELRQELPRILDRGHPLDQIWAFKYGYHQPATDPHADYAAVNVNFWLTADDANLGSESGGMVVYDVEAPADWDFDTYNRRGDVISEFLNSRHPRSVVIPYKENRAIIFDSDLFHATAPFSFRDGYQNRRINVTLLFGKR